VTCMHVRAQNTSIECAHQYRVSVPCMHVSAHNTRTHTYTDVHTYVCTRKFFINFKNILFKGITRGDPWPPLSSSKFLLGRKITKCLHRQDGMGGLVRAYYVCTYE
jgi:hypothetical protein